MEISLGCAWGCPLPRCLEVEVGNTVVDVFQQDRIVAQKLVGAACQAVGVRYFLPLPLPGLQLSVVAALGSGRIAAVGSDVEAQVPGSLTEAGVEDPTTRPRRRTR